MESTAYSIETEIEQEHWWFVGRRRLFAGEICRLGLAADVRIVDVGTGTGTNLRMLRELGFRSVLGLDPHPDAIRFCEAKGLGPVRQGSLDRLPLEDGSCDLVLATDVIEHVDDDAQALREMVRVLAPGGYLLLTVPAFQSLWGGNDEMAQHKRRYRLAFLVQRVEDARLAVMRSYYFNYLLFLPIWLARRMLTLFPQGIESENRINTPWLNVLLGALFRFDVDTAPRLRPPFGVSALVLARKIGV